MKKIFAVILFVVMIMTLSAGALAAGEYSITVNNVSDSISIDGNTYSAYKLFDVDYDLGNNAFNYAIDEDFAGFTYAGNTENLDLVAYVETLAAESDELNDFAEAVYAYAQTNSIPADNSATADGESTTIVLDNAGYYLVFGTATAEEETVTAAIALTTTKPTATVNVKADAPSINKVIVDGDETKATAEDVGNTVKFTLSSKVPTMKGYDTYKYIIHDTMSSGLTFDPASVVVTIGSTTLATGAYTVDTDVAPETFTLTIADLTAYTEGDDIVVTYSAALNENALITANESNTVKLEYSNNPNNEDETGETPEDKVYVYDFDIVIDKYVKGNETTKLAGAKFVLYKETAEGNLYYKLDGTTVTWVSDATDATVATTNADGFASFTGVDKGAYKLEETDAPAGYNKLSAPIAVEITATFNEDGTLASTNTTQDSNGQYFFEADVENSTGNELPTTGAMGTTIFYVIGALLMTVSVVVLVSKKKVGAR